MRRLAWFTVGFALLCLVGSYAPTTALLLAAFAFALLGAAALVVFLRFRNRYDHPPLLSVARRMLAAALGGVIAAGWFAGWTFLFKAPAEELAGSTHTLSGTVADWPEETSIGGYCMTVTLDSGAAAPSVLIYASSQWENLEPGDKITFTARLEAADTLYGSETTYYISQEIFLLGYCDDAPEQVTRPTPTPLRYWPSLAAKALKDSLNEAFGSLSPLAIAITTGDRGGLTDEVTSALSRSGTSHTVAVSGMHLSFLVAAVLMLTRRKRVFALAALPLLFFYALMAGATPSAMRAVVMQVVLLLAPVFRRENDTPTSLSFALLLLLLVNPYAIARVSLQLSFTSVTGILLLAPKLSQKLLQPLKPLRKGKTGIGWNWLFRLATGAAVGLSVSLSSVFFTLPLLCVYFRELSLIFPLSNLLILWAVSLFFAGALALGVLGLFLPAAAAFLAPIPALLGRYILWVILTISQWPFAAVDSGNIYYLLCVVGIYLFAAAAWLFRKDKVRLPIPLGCLALLFAVALLFSRQPIYSQLTVTSLDVGQGASTALISSGSTCLVDCGGNDSRSAGDAAADHFAAMGLRRLDLLVLTHFDADHFNGVKQLFARMDIDQVAIPDVETAYGQMEELLELAEKEGTIVTYVTETVELPLGEASLTLYPPLGSGTSNEEGLFVLCSAGDFDTLITGDADSFVEKMLIKYYNIPDIELLMVGHHGSAGSTCEELLNEVTPELAIISVGYNTYGHPKEVVLSRLEERNIQTYRTDLNGTVTIQVRSDGYAAQTQNG